MTIKAKDFEHIIGKLGFLVRDAGDRLAWFEHEGKIAVRTKRSYTKGRDLPFQHSIRQQMKLNEDQLRRAKGCKLTRDEYVEILRSKGVL